MSTENKDFRVKNGLIVSGTTATVAGSNILTESSGINSLSDVSLTTVSPGQVLKYNGVSWINATDNTGEGGSSGDTLSPFLLMGA
jgi:hypothetical protein